MLPGRRPDESAFTFPRTSGSGIAMGWGQNDRSASLVPQTLITDQHAHGENC